MSDDHEKIASLVVEKLQADNRPDRDEKFMKKLAAMLIEHRSPCHDITDGDMDTIRGWIDRQKTFNKGKFVIGVSLIVFLMKKLYDFFNTNIHWGP